MWFKKDQFVFATLFILSKVNKTHGFNNVWVWYKQALFTRPLITKSLTSCGINAFSDALCQQLAFTKVKKKDGVEKFETERFVHAAVTGLVWSGPVTHYWYQILFGKLVTFKDPILSLGAQIFLDAMIFSPVTVSGYFVVRSILEGSSINGIRDKLSTRLVAVVLGAWKFWPAANVINFMYVPIQFRVLYMNVLSVFWSAYLTFMNAKKIIVKK